jgi:hypothetical protein
MLLLLLPLLPLLLDHACCFLFVLLLLLFAAKKLDHQRHLLLYIFGYSAMLSLLLTKQKQRLDIFVALWWSSMLPPFQPWWIISLVNNMPLQAAGSFW